MTRTVLGFAALLLAVVSAACAAPATPLGHIDVPLTAPGAGGVIYRLPPGTALRLVSNSFSGVFPLDDEAPSLLVDVPPGSYTLRLLNDNGYTTTWPLSREAPDGGEVIVQATLDLPPTITVTENRTVPLTITFHVPITGPITFTHGSVLVFVDIDEAEATSFRFELEMPSMTTFTSFSGDAPTSLPARLPSSGSTAQHYELTAQTTGPWLVQGPTQVCAAATLSFDGTGEAEFADLLAESVPATEPELLCITQTGTGQAVISAVILRVGNATTPLLADLGDRQYVARQTVSATVDAEAFDGTTLRLSTLTGTRPANAQLNADIFVVLGTTTDQWVRLVGFSEATVTMTPQ